MARDTPAKRVRRRKNPAVQPPPRPRSAPVNVKTLTLTVRGRRFPIGANIEGDTGWTMGMGQTAVVTLPVRDPSHKLIAALDDEKLMLQDGVRVTIGGVIYCVTGVEHDGEGLYTLTVEDEVSWRLKQFSSFRSASRERVTRFGFILSFVQEASRPPLARMRAFIPEADDKQPIRQTRRRR